METASRRESGKGSFTLLPLRFQGELRIVPDSLKNPFVTADEVGGENMARLLDRVGGRMPIFALPVPPHWSTQGPLRRTLLDPQQEYLTLSRQLFALVRDGQGDTEEALHLRSRMDAPWARMTAEQQMRACHLVAEFERESEARVRLRIAR
jgi:hypothetical protein